jgi:hypothetical protein
MSRASLEASAFTSLKRRLERLLCSTFCPLAGSRVPVHIQRFAVEFDHRTVGIAVRVPGGFMFYASDDNFNEMDGRVFPRARGIERQLKKVARRRMRPRQTSQARPSLA